MSALGLALDDLRQHWRLDGGVVSWFGEERFDLGDLDEDDRVDAVAGHLYQHWYTTGRAVAAHPNAEVVRDLQPGYDALVGDSTDWFGGWQVVGPDPAREGLVLVSDGSVALTVGRDDVRSGRLGSELRAPLPRRRISPGFYLIPSSQPLDRHRLVRAYVSVEASSATALLSSFLGIRSELNAQAKVLNSTGTFTRLDSFVCYFDRDDLPAVTSWLTDPAAPFATGLKSDSPGLTHPIADGVALAAEPDGSGSFGTIVTSALAVALLGDDLDGARARIAAAGLDPDDPARRSGQGPYPQRMTSGRAAPARGKGRGQAPGLDVDVLVAQIADLLCDEAIRHQGQATWLATAPPLPFQTDRRPVGGTAGPDLYSGTAGIGGFLLRAAARLDDARWSTTGREAVCHTTSRLRADWRAPGWYTGSAGAALEVLRLSADHPGEWDDDIARTVLLEAPDSSWTSPDLLSGLAGSLLATVRAWEVTGDRALLAAGSAWADRLLAGSDGVRASGWVADDGPALAGLSHGAAGIAHALEAWGHHTGDDRVASVVADTVAWEDGHYDATRHNWPDLRPPIGAQQADATQRQFVSYWCHGAPGIMVTRRHSDHAGPPGIDLWATVAQSLDHWSAAGDPALCHGVIGLVEAATLVHGADAERLERVQALIASWGPATQWRLAQHGSFRPSLMLGLAGIGDWLLRLDHPETRSPLDP